MYIKKGPPSRAVTIPIGNSAGATTTPAKAEPAAPPEQPGGVPSVGDGDGDELLCVPCKPGPEMQDPPEMQEEESPSEERGSSAAGSLAAPAAALTAAGDFLASLFGSREKDDVAASVDNGGAPVVIGAASGPGADLEIITRGFRLHGLLFISLPISFCGP